MLKTFKYLVYSIVAFFVGIFLLGIVLAICDPKTRQDIHNRQVMREVERQTERLQAQQDAYDAAHPFEAYQRKRAAGKLAKLDYNLETLDQLKQDFASTADIKDMTEQQDAELVISDAMERRFNIYPMWDKIGAPPIFGTRAQYDAQQKERAEMLGCSHLTMWGRCSGDVSHIMSEMARGNL